MAAETVSFRWEAEWRFTADDGRERKGWAGNDLFSNVVHEMLSDAAKVLGGEDDSRFEDLLYKAFGCYQLRSAAAGADPTMRFCPASWADVKITYSADEGRGNDGPGAAKTVVEG